MRFAKVVWSPIEEEYLRKNIHQPVTQLCIALAKSTSAVKKKMAELNGTAPPPKKKARRSNIGKRKDCNDMFFRSSWEANIYRLLRTDPNIILIEYEPTTFSFTPFGVKHGTVAYTPDFKITMADGSYLWIEVKGGWMKKTDEVKTNRFKKHYPAEFAKLVVVGPSPTSKVCDYFKKVGVPIRWHYPDLNKQYKKTLPGWE